MSAARLTREICELASSGWAGAPIYRATFAQLWSQELLSWAACHSIDTRSLLPGQHTVLVPPLGREVVTKVTHALLIAPALVWLAACAPSRSPAPPPAPAPAAPPPMVEPAPAPPPPPVVEEEHRERRVVRHGRVRHKVHRRHRVRHHQVIEEERQPSSAPEPAPPMSPAPAPNAPYSR